MEAVSKHTSTIFNILSPGDTNHKVRGKWNMCLLMTFVVIALVVFVSVLVVQTTDCGISTISFADAISKGSSDALGDGIYYCTGVMLYEEEWSYCQIGNNQPSTLCPDVYNCKKAGYGSDICNVNCFDYSDYGTTVIEYTMMCIPVSVALVNAANYTILSLTITSLLYCVICMLSSGEYSVLKLADWKKFLNNHGEELEVSQIESIV